HALLLDLLHTGVVDAFRVDHPDGLADPRQYFRWLHEASGGAWVVAEKILEGDEQLPPDWPVAGTTGYDAAWRLGALQVEPAGATALGALMLELTGDQPGSLAEEVDRAKRQIVETSLYAEVHRLTTVLAELCHDDIRLRDHTFRSLMECVVELVIAVDRYRIYVVPGEPPLPSTERLFGEAAERARAHLEADRHETLDVVVDLLLGREVGSAGRMGEARRAEAVIRFQQVCGAVMAKGVEDTAFYRWTHLVSLCEVGSAPERFGFGTDELHAWVQDMQSSWPATMTAGSTHDTKRGEDVRSRIGVLAELAGEWTEMVHTLREATEPSRPADLDGRTENLLWQILAGTWTEDGPISAERLRDYLVKASREQKTWTFWTAPDERRETELLDHATGLLSHPAVVEAFTAWTRRTAGTVRSAILSTKLLQLTVLGVADVYQGTEVTQTSLVDPDNRRPVDFPALQQHLARLDSGAAPVGVDEEKLQLTAAALRLRRARPDAFVGEHARYHPLPTSTGHAVAFARADADAPQVVTVVTRLAHGLKQLGGFGDHTVVLPEGRWREVLTRTELDGGPCPLSELLAVRPVALLERLS
ncbi:malto-oligosyltrehalose synthase, partial [Georgenia sp. 10Sc9-8]|nr:malto-oligosyltrehalose synthase [Georgenia halotolerans]